MSIKSSINDVSNILVFFYYYYNYKNRVLACFQTRPNPLARSLSALTVPISPIDLPIHKPLISFAPLASI